MARLSFFFISLLILLPTRIKAYDLKNAIYSREDSIKIVRLLNEASHHKPSNPMEFFSRRFLNTPYVAHTLEMGDKEMLAINTRELDCTTLVETCAALSLCYLKGKNTFEDYCTLLETLRYRNGKRNSYSSRLHYFCQWIEDNTMLGLVHDMAHEGFPYDAVQKIDIHYMSSHPELYSYLKSHPEELVKIRKDEKAMQGMNIRYIPQRNLNKGKKELKDIRNGDIIVLVTNKDGLDCTHLGIAIWEGDRLHMLNASSLAHKVVIYKDTVYDYLVKRKTLTGIRIIRVGQ